MYVSVKRDCGSLMCDFRVSQQARRLFAHFEIEPTQCAVVKGEARPRSGALFETEKSFLQSETTLLSDFWEGEGSLKLTECAEREGPDGRMGEGGEGGGGKLQQRSANT